MGSELFTVARPDLLYILYMTKFTIVLAFGLLADAARAETAPQLVLDRLDGTIFSLEQALAEGPVVFDFWATWCKPCMKELPHLQNLYEKYKNKKIKFFLIDITEATRTVKGWEDSPKAGPFLAKKGITMPILYDSRGVAKERYGAKTLPRLFIVDKYRTIQLAKTGFDENEDFEAELSAVLDRLSAEQ